VFLRNGSATLKKLLDQLESLAQYLARNTQPLADDAFGKAVDVMASWKKKAIFGFARGGMKLMDQIVSSLSEEELNQIARV